MPLLSPNEHNGTFDSLIIYVCHTSILDGLVQLFITSMPKNGWRQGRRRQCQQARQHPFFTNVNTNWFVWMVIDKIGRGTDVKLSYANAFSMCLKHFVCKDFVCNWFAPLWFHSRCFSYKILKYKCKCLLYFQDGVEAPVHFVMK